jgi:hypothetical protein
MRSGVKNSVKECRFYSVILKYRRLDLAMLLFLFVTKKFLKRKCIKQRIEKI